MRLPTRVVLGGSEGNVRDANVPITTFLGRLRDGDDEAAGQVLSLVYNELRRIAKRRLAEHSSGQSMQPTELVHEAYLRLFGEKMPHLVDRRHFFRAAALTMRRILIDHARTRRRLKRSAPGRRVILDDVLASYEERSIDLLALDEAIERLRAFDALMAQVVEVRFFAGCTIEETAEVVALSVRQTERELALAKGWLRAALTGRGGS